MFTHYAELQCTTNYSYLRGASHPEELVKQAAQLGLYALAITDENTLGGVVRAHSAAKEAGLKLIIGARITPTDGPDVLLYAPNRAAYGRLARLITIGKSNALHNACDQRVTERGAGEMQTDTPHIVSPLPHGRGSVQHRDPGSVQSCSTLPQPPQTTAPSAEASPAIR